MCRHGDLSLTQGHLCHTQLDAKQLHVTLMPFLEKNTSLFMKELWSLLASANQTASHIPQQLLEAEAAKQAAALQAQRAVQVREGCDALAFCMHACVTPHGAFGLHACSRRCHAMRP